MLLTSHAIPYQHAEFSGHGNSIHHIIPLLKKDNVFRVYALDDFCQLHLNLRGLFNAKAVLIEEQ